MLPTLVDDELWELIEPLLPRPARRFRHPGRRRIDDRKVLNGILFVLTQGSPGNDSRENSASARA